jgi:hypothetical protein
VQYEKVHADFNGDLNPTRIQYFLSVSDELNEMRNMIASYIDENTFIKTTTIPDTQVC